MPLTPFQNEVLHTLVANRSAASHFAGGLVLNAVEDLVASSERDCAALETAGFVIEKLGRDGEWARPATFRKARVRRDADSLELDWAHDSSWRFFPIVSDEQLGWRLHLFDMATNKALALSARMETRDYVDIVELCRIYPLEAILWAACGKDPGFNPLSLLKMVIRFARIDPMELDKIKARNLDPVALKEEWVPLTDRAREEMTRLADEQPDLPIGVAFVDRDAKPGWLRNDPTLQLHHPSLRGCWPTMHPAAER